MAPDRSVGPVNPGVKQAVSPEAKTIDGLRIDRSSRARGGFRGWAVGMMVLAAAAGGAFYWWTGRERPRVVRTVVVQERNSARETTLLNASGYVTARREATVSSKVTGKVVEVLIEEGMQVGANEILARLDASNVEQNLKLVEARLELARKAMGETEAALVQAEREFNRVSRLADLNAAAQIEFDRAETETKTLRARLDRQKADIAVSEREVALWRQELDDTTIRAPFAGIVTSKNAQPGEMISPISAGGGFTRTGICTIVDMSSLEIEVDVSETYINRVRPGQPVMAKLDSYPDLEIPAKVVAIIPTADRQKATVKVRIGFDNLDSRILPDMSVKVAFQSSGEPASSRPGSQSRLVVPRAALRQREGRDIVWVVRDGRAERRAVSIGAEQGDEVVLAAGVAAGERVVVEGPDNLKDGGQVTEAAR